MKPPHSTGRNVIAILAIPIVMLFLIVITPFSLGITSPFDLCGMVDAGSRATSLSFICRGVFYEDGIPTGSWQSKLPLLGQIDGCSPLFLPWTSDAKLSNRRPATRLHHPRLRLRTKHR